MCVLRFNVAERVAGTVGTHYAPHKTDIYKSMILRLGPATSRALPIINSLSGRDQKLPIYFTGKKTLINRIMQIDIPAFEDFADGGQGPARITAQVVKQANELVVSVYANMGDVFEGTNLGKLRVHTFLNNKSTLLTLLYRPRRAHMNNISNVRRWQLQSTRVLTFAIRM